jgi:hypothetical protein
MLGLPAQEKIIRRAFQSVYGKAEADMFFHIFQETFFTAADFEILKKCGANFIRVPFNYRLFIDDNQPDILKSEGFELFDRLFKLCAQYQIFVMIDLHAAPGSQNPDWHSDNSVGMPLFWEYSVFRNQTVDLWHAIAGRYCNEPYLMGYDLLNEPAMADWDVLNAFYDNAINRIRTVDKNHLIVLEGSFFSMDFSKLKYFNDTNLAIGFHYYPTVWNPDLLNASMDRGIRKNKIRAGLSGILDQTERFGRPVLCGEFGYAAKDCGSPELAVELLTDTLDLLEEYQVDWLLWCYKDIGYMGMLSPRRGSEWTRLADKIEEDWTQAVEKDQAQFLLDIIKKKWFSSITDEEKYLLQFRLRSCFYMLQGRHILAPKLPETGTAGMRRMAGEFAAENCTLNSDVYKLLTKILKPVRESEL